MSRLSTPRTLLAAALLLGGWGVPAAEAQYFGRNKVQYERFDFQVLQTEHFDIYFYPEEREAALLAGRMAERWYTRLSALLNYEFTDRQPFIVYASHPHFQQTNALTGELGEGTGGATEVFKRRMVLPFGAGLRESDHVIGHELVHAFQFAITGEGRSVQTGGIPGAIRLPLWFIEGMAEYLSVGPRDPQTAMWLRDAMQEKLPGLRDMSSDPFRWFPYRYGHAFWAYVGGRYGDEVVSRLLRTAGRAPDPELAMTRILGGSATELSEHWHQTIRDAYGPVADLTRPAHDYGKPLFPESEGGTTVAPVLSPDGRYVAFLSARDLFSIDVFIAEEATGEVVRKLTRTAVDPHFESLQFINSAGTWSPDGRTFALAAISKGQPVVTLIDVESGKKVRDIRLPELGEILNPSWSPDGERLAFSALVGGLSDLFLYELRTDKLSRLTNDAFADLHPAWSPDGTRIAFVTDRFGSDLRTLEFGRYELAMLDPATGAVERIPAFETGDHTNPQWTPDGTGLFFVSTRTGIPNLYRIELSSGALRQVTNLYGGISGITPLSPAVSVATDGTLAFTAYDRDGYRLYRVNDPAVLSGEPVVPAFVAVDPAVLPPTERISDDVATALANPRTGLPDTAEFATRPYSAGLSLDFVAQPSLVVAADQFGTFLGGGAALYWSDMLGNRSLLTALQVNGGIKDVAAVVGYQNLRRRFNWGVTAQNIPVSFRVLTDFERRVVDGEFVDVLETTLFRQTSRELALMSEYPFSRVQRLEFRAGVRNIDFDQERRRLGFATDGRELFDSTVSLDTFEALNLATGAAALVYDKSLFGATSPIIGQRYRLQVTPVVGSLDYVGTLGDFRRYVVPARPFTVAFRILHSGRYGGDAEDERLRPIFLGWPGLVRGYDDSSFDGGECTEIQRADGSVDDPCTQFSRLIGSRVLVSNLELRFPLLGLLGVGSGYYGFLPIEFFLFGDAGLAWSGDDAYTLSGGPTLADEQAFFFGGDREPVYSVGAGIRLNLLGFAIIELDLARAFQRGILDANGNSQGRWVWQFGFVPGF